MSDEITPELFDRLVELAALELTPEESEYLRKQLNNQLKSIRELEAIPIPPETAPASHGVPYTPATSAPLRADEWSAYPDPVRIIAQAPETEDGFVVVPDIPHEKLD
jgi:aspartyl/glutamyl-tRNA(Asn/Gln) amidotransferase C subunit